MLPDSKTTSEKIISINLEVIKLLKANYNVKKGRGVTTPEVNQLRNDLNKLGQNQMDMINHTKYMQKDIKFYKTKLEEAENIIQ